MQTYPEINRFEEKKPIMEPSCKASCNEMGTTMFHPTVD